MCSAGNPGGPTEALSRFFFPSSVAIVGISSREDGAFRAGGRAVLDHLLAYGFQGEIWPVHPSAESIAGHEVRHSLRDLPEPPDCVVVAVPARSVPEVVQDCAVVGARQVLLLTGGFSELGTEGHELEERVRSIARGHGIRLVGPNSTGLIDVRNRVAMSMTSVLTAGAPLKAGALALVVQSGAIGSSIVERARRADVGISHLASVGNQLDLDTGAFLEYFAGDPHVRVAALYLEGVRDRAAMEQGLSRMKAAGKRVVALLGGQTTTGERAAASHTGKVLGRGALERSLLTSAGVTIVEDLDDLWQVGALLAVDPSAGETPNWAVMTFSGGMGVLTADALAATPAKLATFSRATAERLRDHLPSYVQPTNPLDVGSGAMPDSFHDLVRIVVEDPSVGGLCLPMPMGAEGWQDPIVGAVVDVAKLGKPILVGWYGGDALRGHVERLRSNGVLVVETPTQLGRVVRALAPAGAVERAAPVEVGEPPVESIGGHDALVPLAAAGLDAVPMRRCGSDEELAVAASELRSPLVLKSANAEIAHRLELGLVRVGIPDRPALLAAAAEMREAHEERSPGAALTFLVQEMVGSDHEVLLVVRNAGALGWFGGVGIGGSLIEVLNDIAYVPLPCSPASLAAAVRQLRTAPLWFGHRGTPPVDRAWVSRTLTRLAEVAASEGWTEVEVNPALVGVDGGWIVDALAVPGDVVKGVL